MKHLLTRTVQIMAIIMALTASAFAQESQRGFYEADIQGGGKILFFAENNNGMAVYVFDRAVGQVSIGSATLAANGSFTLTTNRGETMTGTLANREVTVNFRGRNVTGTLGNIFGSGSQVAGRFKGSAKGGNGENMDVTLLITPNGRAFLIGKRNNDFFGGFGDAEVEQDDSDEDTDKKDEDERHDADKHRNQRKFKGKFTVRFGFGDVTVSGSFKLNHGKLKGSFKFEGIDFDFRLDRESADNRLTNISTRAFVNNTPNGQIIAGFIVTGGPKLALIRALGPSLTKQGVTDPVLANPTVTIFRGDQQVAQNDNWQTNSNANDIVATTIPPENSNEAAVLVQLEAGAYTAVVKGADNGTGVALVEVYAINLD